MFFFIGELAGAAHEQKLAAKQAHAHSTGFDRTQRVTGHFNVCQQLNALAVERDSSRVFQAA